MYAILYNFSATIGGCILVVGACVVHSVVPISNAETEGRKDKPFAVQVRSLGCFLNGCGVLMHRMDYVCIILKDLHLRSINYIQIYAKLILAFQHHTHYCRHISFQLQRSVWKLHFIITYHGTNTCIVIENRTLLLKTIIPVGLSFRVP